MNVFSKMAALALLSTASYTAMATEVEERRTSATLQSTVAETEIGRTQAVVPDHWNRMLDPHSYGQASVSYQAHVVSPEVLHSVSFG